jgi:hypothetical protein
LHASLTFVFKVLEPLLSASMASGLAIIASAEAAATCPSVILERAKKPGLRICSKMGTAALPARPA